MCTICASLMSWSDVFSMDSVTGIVQVLQIALPLMARYIIRGKNKIVSHEDQYQVWNYMVLSCRCRRRLCVHWRRWCWVLAPYGHHSCSWCLELDQRGTSNSTGWGGLHVFSTIGEDHFCPSVFCFIEYSITHSWIEWNIQLASLYVFLTALKYQSWIYLLVLAIDNISYIPVMSSYIHSCHSHVPFTFNFQIPVQHDLEGVGENFHDHIMTLGITWSLKSGASPFTSFFYPSSLSSYSDAKGTDKTNTIKLLSEGTDDHLVRDEILVHWNS